MIKTRLGNCPSRALLFLPLHARQPLIVVTNFDTLRDADESCTIASRSKKRV